MSENAHDELLTVAEVAEHLKMNPQTIRNWIDAGTLAAVRIGRRVRVKRGDLDQLVESGYQGPSATPSDAPAGPSAEDFWSGEPVGVAELVAAGIDPPALAVGASDSPVRG